MDAARRLFHALSLLIVSAAIVSCSSMDPAALDRGTTDDPNVPEAYRGVPVADKTSGIQPPKTIKRVEPQPPPGFIHNRDYAIASLGAVIGTDGLIKAIWYSSGDREWAQSAAVALRQWRFEPAIKDGQPVAVRWKLTVTFRATHYSR